MKYLGLYKYNTIDMFFMCLTGIFIGEEHLIAAGITIVIGSIISVYFESKK